MRRSWLLAGAVLAVGLATPSTLRADLPVFQGRVLSVYDGDTLLVEHGSRRELVRLHGVDAPEWTQRYGHSAGDFTAQAVGWGRVRVTQVDVDRYGRVVGLIALADGNVLQEQLLDAGLAWVYRGYLGGSLYRAWIPRERAARNDERGLWRDPDPTPPWIYRQQHH